LVLIDDSRREAPVDAPLMLYRNMRGGGQHDGIPANG
jgi:hypothetical protein